MVQALLVFVVGQKNLPTIFDRRRVDRIMDIPQIEAEKTMRKLAQKEGISAGTSSGGAVWASIQLAQENLKRLLSVSFAIVAIVTFLQVYFQFKTLNKSAIL